MDFFNEASIVEKLPLVIIIVFLVIVIALLMMDRQNLTEISERQNTIKEKIDGIDVPECPACPANPQCPEYPKCPEHPECPEMTCPQVNCPANPGCPACPDHPGCPDITCPACPKHEEKECPVCEQSNTNTNTNSNMPCPKCPMNAECPECPACPSVNKDYTMPTAKDIANAIFPGRNDGILFSGKHYPVKEEYVSRKTPTYSNMNQAMPMGTNSNIVPVTDVFMGGYAPFQNKDPLIPDDNMYPMNFNPYTSMANSNVDICLADPGNEVCTNANKPIMNSNSSNTNQ